MILPADEPVQEGFVEVAALTRKEVERMVVAYQFDLRTNEIKTTLVPNPSAGREHFFKAYRLNGDPIEPVVLRERSREMAEAAYVPDLGDDE
ncbi:hypothetical protein CKO23_23370 [Thiocystis violacea]|nr:hypothetical protein [Thiocystis violacea]